MLFHELSSNVDVVVAGGGPVGLLLACELALAKCSVVVLEKAEGGASTLKQLPFGMRGLSSLTIEALERRGMLQQLELHKQVKNPHATKNPTGPKRQVGHFAGLGFYEGDVDASQFPFRLPSSAPTSLLTSMEEMERVLARRAESLGVVIERGVAVSSFEQNAEEVSVFAGERVFTAKWLVGCDGSRSVVRKLGGFEFAGTEPEFTGYSAQVEMTDSEKLRPGRNLTAAGMYMQSQPGYLVMADFDGGAGHGEVLTRERVQEVLRRISETDVTVTALHAGTTWTDRARQATSYCKGRVLLAGDAAHIHSPLGGQGLNLGVGDAMNLGWKLAAVIQGEAPEGLLESYGAERYPLGEKVLDWSRAQVAVMRPDPASRALAAIVRDVLDTRDGATYFAGRVWGVGTRYELGAEHAMVGRGVPNFEFEDGVRLDEFLRDGRGVLLDFELRPELKAFVREYGGRLKHVVGRAKEQFGLSAVLIRPDGVVVWVAECEVDGDALTKAAERWFVKEAR